MGRLLRLIFTYSKLSLSFLAMTLHVIQITVTVRIGSRRIREDGIGQYSQFKKLPALSIHIAKHQKYPLHILKRQAEHQLVPEPERTQKQQLVQKPLHPH